MEAETRPARLSAEIKDRTGIDEAMISALVTTFYGQVRKDPLIGPIFEAKIDDWSHHLGKLCAFWSSVVLMTGRYHGQPMQAHMSLPVESKHFERWLEIFEATARDVCPPEAAGCLHRPRPSNCGQSGARDCYPSGRDKDP